jgi:hypothetical protein
MISIKYDVNVDEDEVCNYMKLFIEKIQRFGENGFLILDTNVFNIPQHEFIYNLVNSVLKNYKIDSDDYYMVMRCSDIGIKKHYDICSGFGEKHEIIRSDGKTVREYCDLVLHIYFNDNDNILSIGTDLKNNNSDKKPQINELSLFRPRKLSACLMHHANNYFIKDTNNLDQLDKRLYKVWIDFINKNNGKPTYPNLSDVISNEDDLYFNYSYYTPFLNNVPIENIKINSNILELNTESCSSNNYIKNKLDDHDYTFDRLYKSMYPGVYKEEGFEIIHYDEVYTSNTGLKVDYINEDNRCIGFQTVPIETRKIFIELRNYMVNSGYYNMKIIK